MGEPSLIAIYIMGRRYLRVSLFSVAVVAVVDSVAPAPPCTGWGMTTD